MPNNPSAVSNDGLEVEIFGSPEKEKFWLKNMCSFCKKKDEKRAEQVVLAQRRALGSRLKLKT
jgi:hypothetical protein